MDRMVSPSILFSTAAPRCRIEAQAEWQMLTRHKAQESKRHPLISASCRHRRTCRDPQVDLAGDGYYMVDGSVVMKSGVFLEGL